MSILVTAKQAKMKRVNEFVGIYSNKKPVNKKQKFTVDGLNLENLKRTFGEMEIVKGFIRLLNIDLLNEARAKGKNPTSKQKVTADLSNVKEL